MAPQTLLATAIPPGGLLHLRVLAQEPGGTAARLLAAGELDEGVDPGAGDPGDDRAVMRPDPALNRQGIDNSRPARPLVLKRDADLRHRPPLGQKHVVDRPVEAAGAAQSRDIPAPRHDLRFAAREDPTPIERTAIRVGARLAVVAEHLEAPQHPARLLTAAAEAPPAADPVAPLARPPRAAARHGGAGDDGVGALRVDLLHAAVRQAERDQLADAAIAEVPADRAATLSQHLDGAQIGERVELQA